jgi:hypothetical protein
MLTVLTIYRIIMNTRSYVGVNNRSFFLLDEYAHKLVLYDSFKHRSSGLWRHVVMRLDTNGVSQNPEDRDLNLHHRENFKSHTVMCCYLWRKRNLTSDILLKLRDIANIYLYISLAKNVVLRAILLSLRQI